MITNNNDIENISNTDVKSTPTINTEPDILNCLQLPEADELVGIVEKFFWEYTGNFILDDLFNAQLFAYVFNDKVLFCKEKKEWLKDVLGI